MSNKYKISEFGKRIGRSPSTIRRWESEGRIVPKRAASGHRYFDDNDVSLALRIDVPKINKKTVVYCRVSSAGQKNDLDSQVKAMEKFCINAGLTVDQWVSEISGGMNFKRKKFNLLIEEIEKGEISKLLIAHKDRLVRFGFDFFSSFAKRHECEIIVVNQESLSPEREMVEDLMSIVHTFSCRLYGLRNYKKDIQKAVESNA